jgi:hypothetical protein
MAYPDYSIVIISVTTNGVTTDYANAFYNEQLAQKFYDKAVGEGKRAFYFEKPTPSKFVRNDAQPLKLDTEKGLEKLPIPEVSTEQKVGEVAEVIRRYTAPIAIANAFGVQQQVDSAIYNAGVKTYEIWKNFNNFLRRTLIGTTYTLYGTPLLTVTITNKQIQFLADGNGEFIVPPTITKLWPNKDEVEDSAPIQVLIQIEGEPAVNIGSKIVRKTYLGLSATSFNSQDIYTYVPSGTIILSTVTKYYFSDGAGWYYSTNKELPPPNPEDPNPPVNPCPNVGAEISRTWLGDLTYPIVTDTGLETYAQIGQQYNIVTVDNDCGYIPSVLNVYSANGNTVFETDNTWYKSNGTGGVYTQQKPTEPPPDGDGDNGGGGEPENPNCTQEGTELRTSVLTTETGYWSLAGNSGSYVSSVVTVKFYADGTCGEYQGTPENNYIPEGQVIETFTEGALSYTVFATISGNWSHYESPSWDDSGDDWGPNDNRDVPDGNFDFPSNEPCPPAAYGDKTTTSVFKSTPSGDIIGNIRERIITVPLPNGVYVNSITQLGGAMPSNTISVKTGGQYSGRLLSNGSCGWIPETPNVPETWRFPNICFPAGYYSNKHTVVPNPVLWVFSEFDRIEGGQKKFKAYRAYVYHDGQGNVTVQGGV